MAKQRVLPPARRLSADEIQFVRSTYGDSLSDEFYRWLGDESLGLSEEFYYWLDEQEESVLNPEFYRQLGTK